MQLIIQLLDKMKNLLSWAVLACNAAVTKSKQEWSPFIKKNLSLPDLKKIAMSTATMWDYV